MGLFQWRRPVEQRSVVLPTGPFSATGLTPEVTAATSLQVVAVRSVVDFIASMVSELPLDVFRGKGVNRREMAVPDHLQDPAGDGSGYEDWTYQLLMSWLLRGNAYGEVQALSNAGLVTQLSWLYPDDVRGVQRSDGTVEWTVNGRSAPGLQHRRVNSVPGRVLGLSPVEFHATTLGLSLSSSRFGADWFDQGAHPGALLTNDQALDASQAKVAKQRFREATRTSGEPLVLGKGWDYKQIQVAPEESQFLETQRYTEGQCARIFGPGLAEVFGYESGDSMTYANVVERRSDVLVFSLNKWARRVERVLTSMLPGQQYAKFNRDALLEATTLARYQAHAIALQNGFKVVNEVRADEDMPEVAWGNEPFKPLSAAGQTGGGNGNPA